MITIEDVKRAAARIAPYVRKTPLVRAKRMKDDPFPDGELLLKLECLQATGSFKARGATNKLLSYFHPFADPVVIAGQGTTALEILEQEPEVDDLLVAIGGGGLIGGISLTAKGLRPSVRVIGIEPTGSPTLYESVKAGRVVELKEITTSVPTMACLKTEPINLEIVQRFVDEIVLVTDEDMREAARWLWFEMGLAADLSGAASIAALRSGRVRPGKGRKVCALVCGAGPDGLA